MATFYLMAEAESGAGNPDRARELYQRAANWNEDSYDYAFVCAKALAPIGE